MDKPFITCAIVFFAAAGWLLWSLWERTGDIGPVLFFAFLIFVLPLIVVGIAVGFTN